MFYIYLLCLALLIYYFFVKSHNYWESKGIPFEKPFLFLGSFYSVVTKKQHFADILRAIYNKYEDPYVGIYVFNKPHLFIRSPDVLRRILVKDFDKFLNRDVAADEAIDPIAFHALFTSKDTAWKNMRAKMSPVFTSGKMKLMLPLMKDCARDLNDYLTRHDGKTIEARNVTKKYAVDIISSCAFGINSYCLQNENSQIMKMATQLLDFNSAFRNFSVLSFFFIPSFVKLFRLNFLDKTASNYLTNVFRETLEEREEKKIVRNDLVDLLRQLRKNENEEEIYRFDDLKMASQAITFFSAGSDTTSTTLTFALYELALNKEIQDRLRQEITAAFEEAGEFTYENIQEMKYLDMVFNETLRKYPLTTFLSRMTVADYTFEETGLKLEKGVDIIVPTAALHFDPEYFPEPEKFIPERFTDKSKIKPYTYMPFGEGPRNCIGQRFAVLVSKVFLAYTIKDFAFEPTERTPIPMEFTLSSLFLQNKDGVYLKAVKL